MTLARHPPSPRPRIRTAPSPGAHRIQHATPGPSPAARNFHWHPPAVATRRSLNVCRPRRLRPHGTCTTPACTRITLGWTRHARRTRAVGASAAALPAHPPARTRTTYPHPPSRTPWPAPALVHGHSQHGPHRLGPRPPAPVPRTSKDAPEPPLPLSSFTRWARPSPTTSRHQPPLPTTSSTTSDGPRRPNWTACPWKPSDCCSATSEWPPSRGLAPSTTTCSSQLSSEPGAASQSTSGHRVRSTHSTMPSSTASKPPSTKTFPHESSGGCSGGPRPSTWICQATSPGPQSGLRYGLRQPIFSCGWRPPCPPLAPPRAIAPHSAHYSTGSGRSPRPTSASKPSPWNPCCFNCQTHHCTGKSRPSFGLSSARLATCRSAGPNSTTSSLPGPHSLLTRT